MKPCSTKNHIFVIALGMSNILVVSTNLMGIQVFFGILVAVRFLRGVSKCESFQESMEDGA